MFHSALPGGERLAGYNGTVFAYGQTGAGKASPCRRPEATTSNAACSAAVITYSRMDVRGRGHARAICYWIYNEGMYDLLADEIVPDSDLVVVDRDGGSR